MKKILIAAVKLYQVTFAVFLGGRCRFAPSCSEYAVQSIEKKGILKGLWFSTKRILKCQPLHPGGYDPVR